MIIDHETNLVYFSQMLKTNPYYGETCSQILRILKKHGIAYQFLHKTKDIWTRDYMPVQISDNRFVQFQYILDYLKNNPELRSEPQVVCNANKIKPIYSNIVLDGGNIIKWKDKVIVTDKVYLDNPQYKSAHQLIDGLETILEAEVIIIPRIKAEFTGHADGLVRFLDSQTITGNDLSFEYKYWREGMEKVLKQYHIEYINMPTFEYKDKKYPDTAIGCYTNYLEVKNVIIFPVFETKHNKDQQAIDLITDIYPNKIIEPININPVANQGGLMNCISWNISI
ncbi:agmatine deiminase family protein [Limibacter armeniacum]|uniref:agmatine deiminase family protein n=1 Tax=Limibacter armeniacum TaxID=466084 RepID=UPI002FE5E06E